MPLIPLYSLRPLFRAMQHVSATWDFSDVACGRPSHSGDERRLEGLPEDECNGSDRLTMGEYGETSKRLERQRRKIRNGDQSGTIRTNLTMYRTSLDLRFAPDVNT